MTTSALHNAVANVNSGALNYVNLTGQSITIDETLPNITGSGHIDLRGAVVTIDVATNWLYRFYSTNCKIEGGHYAFSGSSVGNTGLCIFNAGAQNTIENMTISQSGTVCKWGAPGNYASRCSAKDIRGSYRGSGNMVTVSNAANARIIDFNINGIGGHNAMIGIVPESGCFVDTVYIDNPGFQSYTSGQLNSGPNYGLDVNTRFGKVVNVWMQNGYIDHTTVAGIRFMGPTAASKNIRMVRIINVRNDADRRLNVQAIQRSRNPANRFQDIKIIYPHFHHDARVAKNMSIAPPARNVDCQVIEPFRLRVNN